MNKDTIQSLITYTQIIKHDAIYKKGQMYFGGHNSNHGDLNSIAHD